MNPHIEILLAIPCMEHRAGQAKPWCPSCGAPPAVVAELERLTAELERLTAELDQQRIRAEMAESELDAYRRTERTDA